MILKQEPLWSYLNTGHEYADSRFDNSKTITGGYRADPRGFRSIVPVIEELISFPAIKA